MGIIGFLIVESLRFKLLRVLRSPFRHDPAGNWQG
jgi:hypothetical protein